jgi:hypothetical protein
VADPPAASPLFAGLVTPAESSELGVVSPLSGLFAATNFNVYKSIISYFLRAQYIFIILVLKVNFHKYQNIEGTRL